MNRNVNGESGGPPHRKLPDIDDGNPFYADLLYYESSEKNHRWAISWSDLMMTMFIFFVVLYIYQAADRELSFGSGPGKNTFSDAGANHIITLNETQPPSQVYDRSRKVIHDVMVDGQSFFNLEKDKTVRMVLAGDFFFDLGSSALKDAARYQLDQVARALNETTHKINIVGHTDDLPSRSQQYPTNWELSSARAVQVARYLMEEGNVAQDRFFISAHAYFQPVAPNTGPENRALNRRVEIILVKEKPFAAAQ
jgi:chemotaxis protein MotB